MAVSQPSEGITMINTLLALLAVVAVMLVHGVAKLVLLPFRAVRALFRHSPRPATVTAN